MSNEDQFRDGTTLHIAPITTTGTTTMDSIGSFAGAFLSPIAADHRYRPSLCSIPEDRSPENERRRSTLLLQRLQERQRRQSLQATTPTSTHPMDTTTKNSDSCTFLSSENSTCTKDDEDNIVVDVTTKEEQLEDEFRGTSGATTNEGNEVEISSAYNQLQTYPVQESYVESSGKEDVRETSVLSNHTTADGVISEPEVDNVQPIPLFSESFRTRMSRLSASYTGSFDGDARPSGREGGTGTVQQSPGSSNLNEPNQQEELIGSVLIRSNLLNKHVYGGSFVEGKVQHVPSYGGDNNIRQPIDQGIPESISGDIGITERAAGDSTGGKGKQVDDTTDHSEKVEVESSRNSPHQRWVSPPKMDTTSETIATQDCDGGNGTPCKSRGKDRPIVACSPKLDAPARVDGIDSSFENHKAGEAATAESATPSHKSDPDLGASRTAFYKHIRGAARRRKNNLARSRDSLVAKEKEQVRYAAQARMQTVSNDQARNENSLDSRRERNVGRYQNDGTYGVPRVQKRPTTVPISPHLGSRRLVPPTSYAAVEEGQTGVPRVVKRPLTVPITPLAGRQHGQPRPMMTDSFARRIESGPVGVPKVSKRPLTVPRTPLVGRRREILKLDDGMTGVPKVHSRPPTKPESPLLGHRRQQHLWTDPGRKLQGLRHVAPVGSPPRSRTTTIPFQHTQQRAQQRQVEDRHTNTYAERRSEERRQQLAALRARLETLRVVL